MMQGKILDSLRRKHDYLSGDCLSQRLGITRQALWKHIQELKEKGYEIVAVPHLGYRFISAPDRLFPFEVSRELQTEAIGRKVYYFETIESTMDAAMAFGLKGCPEGTLVLAEQQTRGRGRLGRVWSSPKYKGIYLSLILRPKTLPARAPLLTLLAAVSVCQAIKEGAGLEAQIKWPNDIFLNHKKVGGVLTELNAETDRINFVIIGIGLNVNTDKKALPAGATSLKEEEGEEVGRVALLQEILRRIEKNYSSFRNRGSRAIVEEWREYSITLGRRVKVYCYKEHIEGQALDIDNDGGLLVRKDSGVTEKVMAGDVLHCR